MAKKIGFIGQGWIGKNYADNFEHRGYDVVRYGIEKEYRKNKTKIKNCDVVFIAVPTPTTPKGFDSSVLEQVIPLVGKEKVAVIKSTVLPGTTEALQKKFKNIFIVHSPEFLTESSARQDVDKPFHNIVGIPKDTKEYRRIAEEVLVLLPRASSELVTDIRTAEMFKYLRNTFFYTKVVFMNLMYDMAKSQGANWSELETLMANDPWIGNQHIRPIHKSGRGAGGHCHIKDFVAFRTFFEAQMNDEKWKAILRALESKNIELLVSTNKDLDLLQEVYGKIPQIT